MKKKLQYIATLILLLGCTFLQAQDLHFSQYFNAPLLVNPANTGFNPDYDYRIGGNYRNQWANVISNPYKTMNLWGDVQLFGNRFEDGWVGAGASLLSDQAGSANMRSTRGYGSVAYHQMLGYSSLLSAGFGVGFVNKSIDVNKLTFDNQWNGKFFDINTNPNEAFAYSSVTYLDVQAGVNYAWFPSDLAYVNIGLSIMHINTPKESFFAESAGVDQRLAPRYTGFINANFKIGNEWIVNPNVYVSQQADATETVLGVNANRNLSGDGVSQLILGVYYRNSDAIIPMIGYQINDLKFTFNYDATTSALGSFSGRQGAYEVSVVKSGLLGSNRSHALKCPRAVRF